MIRSKIGFLNFRILIIVVCFSKQTYSDDIGTLSRILIDAQNENSTKSINGEMKYRIRHSVQKKSIIDIEATARWDRKKIFWTFRLSDPSNSISDKFHQKPVEEATNEYMFQTGERIYIFNAYSNTLHETKFEYPRNTSPHYYLFDVLPNTMGRRCCPPFQALGREWSDLVGTNYSRIFPKSKISMENIENTLIRQTRIDENGSKGIIDFSLNFSGYPVRMEFTDVTNKKANTKSIFTWQNQAGVTILKSCRILRGNNLEDESNAQEKFEFDVLSLVISKTNLDFDIQSLKRLLPKNAILVDHIKNKSTPINPTDKKRISERVLNQLADQIKEEGLVKP